MEEIIIKLSRIKSFVLEGKVSNSMLLEMINTMNQYMIKAEEMISELEIGIMEQQYEYEKLLKEKEKTELLLNTLGISKFSIDSLNFNEFMLSDNKRQYFDKHRKNVKKCLK